MKKVFLILVLILMVCFLLVGCSVDVANYEDPQYLSLEIDSSSLIAEFVAAFPERTSGAELTSNGVIINPCDEAGDWVKSKLEEYAPSMNTQKIGFSYSNPHKDKAVEKAYNIVARKTASSETNKTVVIMAHYDNAATYARNGNVIGGQGVYNNAGGVIVLLQVASIVDKLDLPFNVEFVATSAYEAEYAGSSAYLKTSSDDIVLMINYDKVVGGEYLYMYSDEVSTKHNDLFYNKADEARINIAKLPEYKNNVTGMYLPGTHLAYIHDALLSDHLPFLVKDINVISYSSANYSKRLNNGLMEFDGFANINHTFDDTFVKVKERMGSVEKINERVATIVTSTVNSLRTDNFVALMQESKSTKTDYSIMADGQIMQIVGWVVLIVAAAVALILYIVLKPKAKSHPVIIMTQYGPVDLTKGVILPNGSQQANPNDSDPFAGDDDINDGKSKGDSKPKDVKKSDIFDDF